ncbi:threonine aldolase family protein [Haliovirga abyssi]|uniref:Amino acid lyase n=1 Tax=Haliovirga abyssi TaxID=2996794 RepID=A0AAU9D4Q6_9FUSO|nr:low specificity L-threonine aldolase [Haliovirga abyssi]BDU51026.1 amino acid lyase [Haliovirga abyssi]
MTNITNEKKVYNFKDDYSEGAHERILKALIDTNFEQQNGYGNDEYSEKAKQLLKNKMNNKELDIHFLSGGTQTNLIAISSMLRSYESVIALETGHISVHETGAIEATGHKVNTVKSSDGKITVDLIKSVLDLHIDEHMVKPKMVFISNSTEIGTIYKKKELEKISNFCKNNNLYLYLDGARLGAGLCSEESDLTLEEISNLVDVFYIGGTKNGALLGEALVIINSELKKDFRYYLKQRGALLAKGRIIGIQFLELFKDELYFELATHANLMAKKLSVEIKKLGYKFLSESTTNQIFPIFSNKVIEKIGDKYGFHIWEKIDNNSSTIRLVTSWATKEEMVDKFISDLSKIS